MTQNKQEKLKNIALRSAIIVYGTFAALALTLGVLFTLGIRWMFVQWRNLGMDELIFTVTSPIEGANRELYFEFAWFVIPTTTLVVALFLTLFFSKHFRIRTLALIMTSMVMLGVGLTASVAYYTWNRLDVSTFIANQSIISDFIGEQYVDPKNVNLTFPDNPRNLIFIYLESIETTFADKESGGDFEINLIPELTSIAKENEDFSGDDSRINGGISLPGSGWTMGAMFAQTAGLPLNITGIMDTNAMMYQESFFPELLTLGGILEEAGYYQALLIGSGKRFGGRELYYTTHGNFTFWDYWYAHDNGYIPEGHRVFWGFEDWRLFEIAQSKLPELAAKDQPFHLSMLTVDTHAYGGWLCELCPPVEDNQYSSTLRCSSAQIYEFLNWIMQQDFYENTTVILSGDHLTHDGTFSEHFNESDYQRRTFTAFVNAPIEPIQPNLRREFSTMDMFPTTLAAMGVEIPGNRLGLGTDLFSVSPTLIERFGLAEVTAELSKRSDFIEHLNRDLQPIEE